MSECSQTCIFQNKGECWFACKDKIRAEEYNRIIGFLKYNRYAIVNNNGDYYSIEELEDLLKGQADENNV